MFVTSDEVKWQNAHDKEHEAIKAEHKSRANKWSDKLISVIISTVVPPIIWVIALAIVQAGP